MTSLILACGGSTPHITASLKFDTIRAMVRQFGQRRFQEKIEW
jgi:hypothetical protein